MMQIADFLGVHDSAVSRWLNKQEERDKQSQYAVLQDPGHQLGRKREHAAHAGGCKIGSTCLQEGESLKPTILRTNATGVYRFLSLIRGRLAEGETLDGRRILDCGAGGRVPPLSVFAEQGMGCVGIDISERRVEAACAYAAAHELPIEFRVADMREVPFPDASFDYVFEHYSMCHLSKADTARAVEEMRRVLKPGGTAFFGVISSESWPLSTYGDEREPGEFWMVEEGEEARHSVFTDEECEHLVSGWEVLSKERAVLHHGGKELTEEAWRGLYEEAPQDVSGEVWQALYPRRCDFFRYVHAYYLLRKPS